MGGGGNGGKGTLMRHEADDINRSHMIKGPEAILRGLRTLGTTESL